MRKDAATGNENPDWIGLCPGLKTGRIHNYGKDYEGHDNR